MNRTILIIGGTASVGLAVAFLGSMAVMIGALPFIIITFGVLILVVTDFVLEVKNMKNGENNGKPEPENNAAEG